MAKFTYNFQSFIKWLLAIWFILFSILMFVPAFVVLFNESKPLQAPTPPIPPTSLSINLPDSIKTPEGQKSYIEAIGRQIDIYEKQVAAYDKMVDVYKNEVIAQKLYKEWQLKSKVERELFNANLFMARSYRNVKNRIKKKLQFS